MALIDNLISWWELGEATGTGDRNDSHGTNHLTASASITQATGKVGNCAEFSGSNELTHADNADLSTGDIDITICGWFFLQASPPNSGQGLIGKHHSAAGEGEYQVLYGKDAVGLEYWRFKWGQETGVVTVTHPPGFNGTFTKDAWHFWAVRHDATNNLIRLRVNTTDETALATGGHAPTNLDGVFSLGGNGPSKVASGGRLDQVGFWKRHLSDAELTSLYNSGNGLAYADLAPAATKAPLPRRQPLRVWTRPTRW